MRSRLVSFFPPVLRGLLAVLSAGVGLGAGAGAEPTPPLQSPASVQDFLVTLEADLAEGSPQLLAEHAPAAQRALAFLRELDRDGARADWLAPRLDLLEAAVEMQQRVATPLLDEYRPQYTRAYWTRVLEARRAPRGAAEFVPRLKKIFRQAGVPAEWVWIAEVESAMNPVATSPAGAHGLFQFMPATAGRFGLGITEDADERADPEKSAQAAAAYLRILHRRFQSWPLALAAYNAGEGRVSRALAAHGAATFDAVSPRLPMETRMYVPKVLATVALREAVEPETLPPPTAVAIAVATPEPEAR